MKAFRRTALRSVASVAALGLVLTACSSDDGDDGDSGSDSTPSESEASSPAATDGTEGGGGGEIATDVGVTEEPCQNAPTGSEDRGCIYLGSITDLSGIFQSVGTTISLAQQIFWDDVNTNGGIAGMYDVDVRTYVEDTGYDPTVHAEAYDKIAGDVLMLGRSLGTPHTLGILGAMEEDNMIAGAVTLWSGWTQQPRVIQNGDNYCTQGMNAVDWNVENNDIQSVMSIQLAGDYGGDSAAGVEAAADANGIEFMPTDNFAGVDGAVQAILSGSPDLVVLATGVADGAQIIGQALGRGYTGRFAASSPLASVPLVALGGLAEGDDGLATALTGTTDFMTPSQPFGSDTPEHQRMIELLGEESPGNEFFTIGFIAQNALHQILEAAADNGDLTRQGLFDVVSDNFVASFNGAQADQQLTGDPNEIIVRDSYIGQFSTEAPLGMALQQPEKYAGSTAADHDFSEPCVAVG